MTGTPVRYLFRYGNLNLIHTKSLVRLVSSRTGIDKGGRIDRIRALRSILLNPFEGSLHYCGELYSARIYRSILLGRWHISDATIASEKAS